MLILGHERGLPSASASLIQKIGQRVFVLTCVASKLDYDSLVFFHMRVSIFMPKTEIEARHE